jgi:hypothetical protein
MLMMMHMIWYYYLRWLYWPVDGGGFGFDPGLLALTFDLF